MLEKPCRCLFASFLAGNRGQGAGGGGGGEEDEVIEEESMQTGRMHLALHSHGVVASGLVWQHSFLPLGAALLQRPRHAGARCNRDHHGGRFCMVSSAGSSIAIDRRSSVHRWLRNQSFRSSSGGCLLGFEHSTGAAAVARARFESSADWDTLLPIAELVVCTGGSVSSLSPEDSLKNATWTKLICGASFEDVVDVRNLSLVYTLVGVDCVDCAADPAVVSAVKEGVDAAMALAALIGSRSDGGTSGLRLRRPWIMVSINDHEDPHFRKAEFDVTRCPSDCQRPCERVCPAAAIWFPDKFLSEEVRIQSGEDTEAARMAQRSELTALPAEGVEGGVVQERCYGCGRCVPICPYGLIDARYHLRDVEHVGQLLSAGEVDAVEIHTRTGYSPSFVNLWKGLSRRVGGLRLVAVSVPDLGEEMVDTMTDMYNLMQPAVHDRLLWQLDGRPMSGDIGAGATMAAVQLGKRILKCNSRPPGYLQLAGGTNAHTVASMKAAGIWNGKSEIVAMAEVDSTGSIAGVAYGGYARKIMRGVLKAAQDRKCETNRAEGMPMQLSPAVSLSSGTEGAAGMVEVLASRQPPASQRDQVFKRPKDGNELMADTVKGKSSQRLETSPELLLEALRLAAALVAPLKGFQIPKKRLVDV
ncbi:hypothetical protein CBR_g50285 [Chara braunii]|uniref:4Fe-4S ferredoxin-type domain-containing protein n=1 Tax=Chara braunii TaxID=69332 RepID=A0A388K5M1_CHABU|nr:hypothetical protein CBR_g50285 [Chara braunii]|eukprot:GBG65243.1 hypothetical protein CBR_g50285 [Chara braunii]